MKLGQHNDILGELEKLLDDNLGKMDPAEYAKLKAEYDSMVQERDTLAASLAEAKAESDGLVDKVVATEAERDALAKRLDDVAAGSTAFEARIEELLKRIADLEAEVERRDAVVLKMAEKYQLVEKDSFGDDLVAAANTTEAEETKNT
jgi:septal ring factor EnvC (AmiA/AmiB activator)